MKRTSLLNIILISITLFILIGCGSDEGDVKGVPEKLVSEKGEPSGDNKGVLLGKEILQTYDLAVSEIKAALKDKPPAADAAPKIETIYEKYKPIMAGINQRYLALKTEDIVLFGAANGYLGENRGKHVFKKDNDLGEFINHYSITDKSENVINLLKQGLFKLLETAVKR